MSGTQRQSAARPQRRRAALERDVSSYYDSLSEEEAKEQRSWGDFALKNQAPFGLVMLNQFPELSFITASTP
jgi:hypothetical protein